MADAVRKFITDEETGAIKLQFLDAATGLDIPLTELLDYNILAENGLGEVTPVNAGITTPEVAPVAPEFLAAPPPVVQQGRGAENSSFGDGRPRSQSNNFGYVDKPGILGAAKFAGPIGQVAGALGATGLMGPIGAVGVAGRMVGGMINNNNALATSQARVSIGLDPSNAARIAKDTISDNKGQVADVNANGQTYSVGLEAETEDGRSTLTPNEARNRSLGQAVEATPEESAANVSKFNAEPGLSRKGLLGRVADTVLGRTPETSAPLAATTPTVSTSPEAPTSAVERSNLPSVASSPFGSVKASVSSQMGINTSGTGLIGALKDTRESIPSVPASKLGAFSTTPTAEPTTNTNLNQENKAPGLAGISSTFNKGTYGTLGTLDRANLDPSIDKALNKVEGALGPDVGVNSGYRDPGKNARVGGAKSSQHIQGKAVDLNTVGWTPAQKATALDAAATAGVKGVGIYDGGRSLHLDTRESFGTWGPSPQGAYKGVGIADQPGWAQDTLQAIEDAGPFNPGPKIGPIAQDKPVGPAPTPGTVANTGLAGMVNSNVDNMSVGRLQNEGFAPSYTDQEMSTMAVAAAGELGPDTLRGVARQDPKAMAELGSVVSTMSNRMAQEGVAGITNPTQFNAFSQTPNKKTGVAPATTTRANFEKFGGALMDGVKAVTTGAVQSPTPDATHYANYGVADVDKSWKNDMTNVSQVGQHTVGTIPGSFNAKKSAASIQQADRAKQAVSNFSEYSGVARQEQKADRAVTAAAPSAGLASKPSAPAKSESAKASPSKSEASKTSGPSNGTSGSPSKGSGGPSSSSGGVGASSKSSSSTGSSASSKSSSDSDSKDGGSKGGKSGGSSKSGKK